PLPRRHLPGVPGSPPLRLSSPGEDQGYLIVAVQGPEGNVSGLHTPGAPPGGGTCCAKQPEVQDIFTVGGFSLLG
ncbi:hypothetical protein ACLESO_60200, partial [Pyxidicoccus sp. 3LG]